MSRAATANTEPSSTSLISYFLGNPFCASRISCYDLRGCRFLFYILYGRLTDEFRFVGVLFVRNGPYYVGRSFLGSLTGSFRDFRVLLLRAGLVGS